MLLLIVVASPSGCSLSTGRTVGFAWNGDQHFQKQQSIRKKPLDNNKNKKEFGIRKKSAVSLKKQRISERRQ
ncbi:hypothetical protein P4V41_17175, partial [Fictibacillus nanhaiensis]|uniref:hypothetical protein n=1 Tax=Fictibacillus nanhaiensis TaxID=742169 RepID=UPI002E1B9486|nr:hypothetical protein [Fictibacillus nanhaiensis]